MIVARRFLIGGRVQGVGFRMFAEARAAVEGVHGYVQNLPDGSVEALVEGDDEAVDRIEMALRRGPAGADVESFEVEIRRPHCAPRDSRRGRVLRNFRTLEL